MYLIISWGRHVTLSLCTVTTCVFDVALIEHFADALIIFFLNGLKNSLLQRAFTWYITYEVCAMYNNIAYFSIMIILQLIVNSFLLLHEIVSFWYVFVVSCLSLSYLGCNQNLFVEGGPYSKCLEGCMTIVHILRNYEHT